MSREKSLTAEEICAIIKTCAGSGVSHLKFSGLSVQFHGPATEIVVGQDVPFEESTQSQPASQNPQKASEPAIPTPQELADLEEWLWAVEDPVAFEESQTKGNA